MKRRRVLSVMAAATTLVLVLTACSVTEQSGGSGNSESSSNAENSVTISATSRIDSNDSSVDNNKDEVNSQPNVSDESSDISESNNYEDTDSASSNSKEDTDSVSSKPNSTDDTSKNTESEVNSKEENLTSQPVPIEKPTTSSENNNTSSQPSTTKEETTKGNNKSENPTHQHKWSEWVTVKESSCTENGIAERTCTCGKKESKSIDLTPHKEVIDQAVAATCTKTGLTQGIHCEQCGKIIKKQAVIEAKGHYEVIDKGVKATCTEDGLSDGKHCNRCGKIFKGQTVIKATGHNEVTDEAVEPTCSTDGLTEGKHCSLCGLITKNQEIVKATGIHTGQYNCEQCGLNFFDMLKDILVKNGTYQSDKYTVSYNSSDGNITVRYYRSLTASNDGKEMVLTMNKNSNYLSWKYTKEIQKLVYSNGVLCSAGIETKYMGGSISRASYDRTSKSISTEYNTFSKTVYSNLSTTEYSRAYWEAASYIHESIGLLENIISEYGDGKFTLYNLGFSNL